MMESKIQVHLGDGAYFTYEEGSAVMTANHHDPRVATDAVYLDCYALDGLFKCLKEIMKGADGD